MKGDISKDARERKGRWKVVRGGRRRQEVLKEPVWGILSFPKKPEKFQFFLSIGRPRRYCGFGSRPPQESEYCNKTSHMHFFLFPCISKLR